MNESRMQPPIGYYIGHSNNPDIRYKASSGGIGTGIIQYLLSSGAYDTSVTFIYDKNKCMYVPQIIHSPEEINNCGSIYQDINLYSYIKNNINEIKKGIVITCLPCQIDALRNLFDKYNKANFIISFCCSGQTTTEGTWKYYELLGINRKDVTNIQYRGNGWPSGIFISLKNGSNIYKKNYTDPWKTLHQTKLYSPKRCFYCKRDSGRGADIALADPWIEQYIQNDKIGNTLFMILTQKGEAIFQELRKRNKIICTESSYHDYATAQMPNILKEKNVNENLEGLKIQTKIISNKFYFNWASKNIKNMHIHIFLLRLINRIFS